MKVTILGDLGPCFGVERAIDEAIDIHQSFPYSKIYFPHPMVHNQRTNDLVKEKQDLRFLLPSLRLTSIICRMNPSLCFQPTGTPLSKNHC